MKSKTLKGLSFFLAIFCTLFTTSFSQPVAKQEQRIKLSNVLHETQQIVDEAILNLQGATSFLNTLHSTVKSQNDKYIKKLFDELYRNQILYRDQHAQVYYNTHNNSGLTHNVGPIAVTIDDENKDASNMKETKQDQKVLLRNLGHQLHRIKNSIRQALKPKLHSQSKQQKKQQQYHHIEHDLTKFIASINQLYHYHMKFDKDAMTIKKTVQVLLKGENGKPAICSSSSFTDCHELTCLPDLSSMMTKLKSKPRTKDDENDSQSTANITRKQKSLPNVFGEAFPTLLSDDNWFIETILKKDVNGPESSSSHSSSHQTIEKLIPFEEKKEGNNIDTVENNVLKKRNSESIKEKETFLYTTVISSSPEDDLINMVKSLISSQKNQHQHHQDNSNQTGTNGDNEVKNCLALVSSLNKIQMELGQAKDQVFAKASFTKTKKHFHKIKEHLLSISRMLKKINV